MLLEHSRQLRLAEARERDNAVIAMGSRHLGDDGSGRNLLDDDDELKDKSQRHRQRRNKSPEVLTHLAGSRSVDSPRQEEEHTEKPSESNPRHVQESRSPSISALVDDADLGDMNKMSFELEEVNARLEDLKSLNQPQSTGGALATEALTTKPTSSISPVSPVPPLDPISRDTMHDRWAQIRKNAAERASQREESGRMVEGTEEADESIEQRVARIKQRVKELTAEVTN